MFSDQPDGIGESFMQISAPPVCFKLVYDCKTVEECEAFIGPLRRYHDFYIIYDNKWMNGDTYVQMRFLDKGTVFRASKAYLQTTITSIVGGIKSKKEYVEYYQKGVSDGKIPPL
jgi:hypothetical protein